MTADNVQPTSGNPAFLLTDVSVDFGSVVAVDKVSLQIKRGEHIALIGPSGSGKTTLLRLLNGVQDPTSGSVAIEGRDFRSLGARYRRQTRSKVGWIPQALGIVPNLRVVQNVALGAAGRTGLFSLIRKLTFPSRADQLDILKRLERVGIADKMFEPTAELSGGQQQRVAIARSLFQRPMSLLADEPVSSVDPARAADIVRLLTELATENGVTLVMSLHNLALAKEFFPRLIGMRSGKIVVDGAPETLSEDALNDLFSLTTDEIISGE